ncbi:MAG: hypothetical protein P4L33_11160 [Capsulimonadaceae bacterium]|nr:hypothetical protein [Capsulimonadaceae bacterium]
MKRAVWAALTAVTLLILPGKFAGALTFRAALTPIHVTAQPGDVVNSTYFMTVIKAEHPTHFRVHAEDYYKNEDGSGNYLSPGHISHSCANWIQLNPGEATINVGEMLKVRMTIAVPTGAKPGGYWCVMTIDEVPDPDAVASQQQQGRSIGVRSLTSISVNVYVDILPLDKEARIMSVQIGGDQAVLRVADTGNCELTATGRIEFAKPGDDKSIAIAPIQKTSIFCEPVNTTSIKVDLPTTDVLPSGRYLVRVVLDIGLDHYIGAQKEMEIDRVPETNNTGAGTSPK